MDQSAIELTLQQLKSQIDRIAGAVLGDPGDTQRPGHCVRLDRLEQTNKFQGRLLLALGGGLITLGCTVAATLLIRVI